MNSIPDPARPVKPPRPPGPPPVVSRCPRCHSPLIVWSGEACCANCDVALLPPDDAWLAEDDCGRDG
jgi:hypothetical protein